MNASRAIQRHCRAPSGGWFKQDGIDPEIFAKNLVATATGRWETSGTRKSRKEQWHAFTWFGTAKQPQA
ncbi:MAG: hypothetical protein ACXWLW_11425, partial [Rhizomicrobium sp.]